MFLPPMNLCWKPHEHMFLENTAPLLDFLVEISSEILTIWQSIFPVVNSFEELSQLKSSNELTHLIEWVDSTIWGYLQMKIRTLSELFTSIQLNCRRTTKISTPHLIMDFSWTSHGPLYANPIFKAMSSPWLSHVITGTFVLVRTCGQADISSYRDIKKGI